MALKITIKVRPSASKNEIKRVENGVIYVNIAAPAQKGKANKEIVKYFAEVFNVKKTDITIVSGEKSRIKTLKIEIDRSSFDKILSSIKK